jgi:hypothetical protein
LPLGKAAGFGVPEFAPAFQSGGKPPHSNYEGKKDLGADLLQRCPDLLPAPSPPICARAIPNL